MGLGERLGGGAGGLASALLRLPIQEIDRAYDRMVKSDVKYRFVIDMQSLKREAA